MEQKYNTAFRTIQFSAIYYTISQGGFQMIVENNQVITLVLLSLRFDIDRVVSLVRN